MKTITIEIDNEGEVKIDAIGFKGKACEAATKIAEDALGIVIERKRKPEYFATTTATNKQRIGQ